MKKNNQALFLNKEYLKYGYNEASLLPELKYMDDNTMYKDFDPAFCDFVSVIREKRKEQAIEFVVFSPDYSDFETLFPRKGKKFEFSAENGNWGYIAKSKLLEYMTEEQLKEMLNEGYYISYRNPDGRKQIMLPSSGFTVQLCKALGVGKLPNGADPMKMMYLASKCWDTDPFKVLLRKCDTHTKVFNIYKNGNRVSQMDLFRGVKERLTQERGNITVREWSITHSITSIVFCFNKESIRVGRTLVIPGVRLVMSETGDAAYQLQNILYCNGGVVYLKNNVSKKHAVSFSVESLFEDYRVNAAWQIPYIMELLRSCDTDELYGLNKTFRLLLKKSSIMNTIGKALYEKVLAAYNEHHACEQEAPLIAAVLELMKLPGIYRSSDLLTVNTVGRFSSCVGDVISDLNTKEFSSLKAKKCG